MNTPLYKYITCLTKCHQGEYENTDDIKELLEAQKVLDKEGLTDKDDFIKMIWDKKLFICQNPTINQLIEEIKKDEKFKDYQNGKPNLKGYLLGKLIKKYPGCDLEAVSERI